jgi:hypothetical protein
MIRMMPRLLLSALLTTTFLLADFKLEKSGPSPVATAEVAKEGAKVLDAAGKVICEVWMRSPIPTGPKSEEQAVTLPEVAHGTFMGVVSFPQKYSDRRGQQIKAGVYTMRYSYFPQNGDHQGVAPQRDFLLLTPAGEDKELASKPDFNTLTEMSRKASGTPHPSVFSFWKEEENFKPGLQAMGEHDWVLYTDAGGIKLGIILVGSADH